MLSAGNSLKHRQILQGRYARIGMTGSLLIHAAGLAFLSIPAFVRAPAAARTENPVRMVLFAKMEAPVERVTPALPQIPRPAQAPEHSGGGDSPPDSGSLPRLEQFPSAETRSREASMADSPEMPEPSTAPEEYLPQHRITDPPVIPAREALSRIEYPPLAARQGIEATVYLELYIDRNGRILQVSILKDPGYGFSEAAVQALLGLECVPAKMNGQEVAVRYRYPVRFTLK